MSVPKAWFSARTRLRRSSRARDKRDILVCPCHDVTQADLEGLWAQGYQHPETLKRGSAVFMGPCQGKYCTPLVQAFLEDHGEPRPSRRPSVRPPLYPIPLGALAYPDPPPDDGPQDLS